MELEAEKKLKEKGIDYNILHIKKSPTFFGHLKKMFFGGKNSEPSKIFIAKGKKKTYVFLVPQTKKPDPGKFKKAAGEKVKVLGFKKTKKLTGKFPGAVCPLLLPKSFVIFIDKDFEGKKIRFSSGNHFLDIEMNEEDLKKIKDFKTASL